MSALVWHSSFASFTGYSGSSLQFVLGLDDRGVAIRPLFLYGADHDEQVMAGQMHPRIRELQAKSPRLDLPQVVYGPGDRFSKNSGAYRIGFTMLEVDRLPRSWVEQANQMHEVWTPTEWGVEMLRSSGVRVPLFAVPLGVDMTLFRPSPARARLADRTIFVSVFEWGSRKGWDILLRAYRAAFRANDPVLLLLKIDCRVPGTNPVREIARLLPDPSPAVGLIYNQPLTSAQLVELYGSADCFVLPTRGEGWGMPILEAMACGLPAIATAWSAPTAFVTAANSYPLPISGLVPAPNDAPYYRGAQWADPDVAALVELMRQVVDDPTERRRRGLQAALDAQQWGWDHGLDIIEERLVSI